MSMSGYSPAALADVKDGQRLEVILLDRHHVEAMLSGLCPPEELLEGVLDGAHFLGDAYTSLENVLCTTPRPLDAIFGPAPELPTPITFAADGVTAEVVPRSLPFGHLGIAATGRGRLVITTGDGLYDIDLVKGAATPRRAPLGIDRPARVMGDGRLAFVRRNGVGTYADGVLTVVSGGVAPGACIIDGGDGALWAFSQSSASWPLRTTGEVLLVKPGKRLGEDEVERVACPSNAVGADAGHRARCDLAPKAVERPARSASGVRRY